MRGSILRGCVLGDHGQLIGLADDDHCFSADTELLTERGFIDYSEIKDTDKALTLNLNTDKLEYQQIQKKYVYDSFKEVVSLQNRYGEILVTRKHRMIFKNTTNAEKKNPSAKWFECTAEDALGKSVLTIPTGGLAEGKELLFSNRFAELLGIIISEGHFIEPRLGGYGVQIYQNKGEQADYIEKLLLELKVPFTKASRETVVFYIRSPWAKANIRKWLEKKDISASLMSLRGEQFMWFLSGLILGDGSVRGVGPMDKLMSLEKLRTAFDGTIRYSYHSGDKALIDNLSHLCTLNGLSAYAHYRKGGFKNGCWTVNIKNSRETLFKKGSKRIKEYSGSVWCVSVPNQTLVLRRNGFIFVAGNTQYHTDARAATWLSGKSIADIGTRTHSLLGSLTADDHTQYPLLLGRSGGQTLIGGTASGNGLTLQSTSDATKGKILFGTSAYDEVNNRLGIGTTGPDGKIEVQGISDLGASSKAVQLGVYDTAVMALGVGAWLALGGKWSDATQTSFGAIAGKKENGTNSNASGYLAFFTRRHGVAMLNCERIRIDSSGNVGIGTVSPTSRIHGVATLSAATGNEIAYQLDYTTNKATSGNDTGLLINMTDTASPGISNLLDLQVGGASRFRVSNGGTGIFIGNLAVGTSITNGAQTLSANPINMAGLTSTATSGNIVGVAIIPTYNQTSGTAANTDLLINRTQTAVGSGAQLLIDAQVGGVSKFSVTNLGALVTAAGFGCNGAAAQAAYTVGAASTDLATVVALANNLRAALVANGIAVN